FEKNEKNIGLIKDFVSSADNSIGLIREQSDFLKKHKENIQRIIRSKASLVEKINAYMKSLEDIYQPRFASAGMQEDYAGFLEVITGLRDQLSGLKKVSLQAGLTKFNQEFSALKDRFDSELKAKLELIEKKPLARPVVESPVRPAVVSKEIGRSLFDSPLEKTRRDRIRRRSSIKTENFQPGKTIEVNEINIKQEISNEITKTDQNIRTVIVSSGVLDSYMDNNGKDVIYVDEIFYNKITSGELSNVSFELWWRHERNHIYFNKDANGVAELNSLVYGQVVKEVKSQIDEIAPLDTRLSDLNMNTNVVFEEALATFEAMPFMTFEKLELLEADMDKILAYPQYAKLKELLGKDSDKLEAILDMVRTAKTMAQENPDDFVKVTIQDAGVENTLSNRLFKRIAEDKLLYYWS
ncbi:hypothetical protein KKC59_03975, partial [bacterium]|nr:hypothetical protein [bacterium]